MFKPDHEKMQLNIKAGRCASGKTRTAAPRIGAGMSMLPAVAVAGSPGFVKGIMTPSGLTIPYIDKKTLWC